MVVDGVVVADSVAAMDAQLAVNQLAAGAIPDNEWSILYHTSTTD